jgi:hydroxymethylpyrimidine/phosphomethylpyrimidine kinase
MKVVLTIAGSDSSGGAGIQADLKTFEAFGVFGASVLTVLTAQNTAGVRSIQEIPAIFVKEQLEAVRDDFEIAAIKVGMLYSREIIETVHDFLSTVSCPIVIDPVCISKAGSPLLQEDALAKLPSLFAFASVVTPNQFEAKKLFGYTFGDTDSLHGVVDSPAPVLIKNQTLQTSTQSISIDQLIFKHERRIFQTPHLETSNLHGTGCSYSSAIAANLALGHTLEEAIDVAKRFVYESLKTAPAIGHGPGPINHKEGGKGVA